VRGVQGMLDGGRRRLTDIIENNTLERSRALMNGGLCERLFDLAKMCLDERDDPAHPTNILTEADLVTGTTSGIFLRMATGDRA
jgi:hypothetical protein